MSELSIQRIKRRILQRQRDFDAGLRKSDERLYKASAPVGRALRNNPDHEGMSGKEIAMLRYRQSRAYRSKQK